jgi:NAD(P)-dependent dehydrogenase (short-subunit alcohol dehydrogenase family)
VSRTQPVGLVTGAAKNIGAAIATRLAADGLAVAVNHRSETSTVDAEAVVATIESRGGRARRYEADLADPAAITAMIERVHADLGPVTALVNNAATSVASNVSWLEITPEEWDRVQATNLRGAFLCARAVHAGMVAAGGGSIVNLSSVRVPLGRPGNLHYTASKAGVIGLTRTLAREVGADGIRVNCLVVGAIRTPDEALYGAQAEIDAMLLELQSLKFRGLPEDVADAAAFLVSTASRFVTGQCITVDGGWVMT